MAEVEMTLVLIQLGVRQDHMAELRELLWPCQTEPALKHLRSPALVFSLKLKEAFVGVWGFSFKL